MEELQYKPQHFYSSTRTDDMANHYEPLALKFAPELYYVKTENPLENIAPEDLGGLYWRSVPSTVPWAGVCIQYMVYFKQQRWVKGIFDRFAGKLPGNHPNDYAPLFIYFKNEIPVRAVFDICHYEAVGAVNTPSAVLPLDERPKFQVKNFYRGLIPLEDHKKYTPLGGVPIRMSQERLTEWWKGFTGNIYDEKARLIIKEKLENPFKKITTFRDRAGKLGFLFHWIFRSAKEYQVKGLPIDVSTITSHIEKGMGDKIKYFSRVTLEETAEFVNATVFKDLEVPEYLALRGYKKYQRV